MRRSFQIAILAIIYMIPTIYLAFIAYSVVVYVLLILAFLSTGITVWRWNVKPSDLCRYALLIFILALCLRSIMLYQSQIITKDMIVYVNRGHNLVSGQIPYRDFTVHKPPMYLYLGAGLVLTLGTSRTAFRAFFSILDATVAAVILILGWRFAGRRIGVWAGFMYAISPLNTVMIGMSGHYDPSVILLATLALYLNLRGRRDMSYMLMGLAFSLKYYTLVYLPFMLVNEERRLRATLLFFLPMLLSWIPLLAVYPASLHAYLLGYQATSWAEELHKSFSYAIYWIVGAPSGGARIIAYLVSALTSALLIFYVLGSIGRTWRAEKERSLFGLMARLGKRLNSALGIDDNFHLFWLKGLIILIIVYHGLVTLAHILRFSGDLGLEHSTLWASFFACIYFPMAFILFIRYHRRLTVPDLTPFQTLMMDLTLALLLFLYASPNFTPWYLMWVLPTLVLISPYIGHTLLLIIPWNFPGRELRPW